MKLCELPIENCVTVSMWLTSKIC